MAVWKENLTKIYEKHAPIKRRKIRNQSNPWITEQLLHEKRHKNDLTFITYKLGGKCPPSPSLCAPRNHILLFPKFIQTNQRRITNR